MSVFDRLIDTLCLGIDKLRETLSAGLNAREEEDALIDDLSETEA